MSTSRPAQVSRRLERVARAAGLGVVLAAALGVTSGSVARAQTPGDVVVIETDAGPINGMLLDRLPDGYLVRVEGRSQVVPYATVKSIVRAPSSAPLPSAPPSPVVVPSAPPPSAPPPGLTPRVDAPLVAVEPAPSPSPLLPPKPRASALTTGGAMATVFGSIGLVVGALVVPAGLLLRSTQACHDKAGTITFDCAYGNGGALVTGGAVTLVTGGVLLAGGVTMLAVGNTSAKAKRGSVLAPAALTVAPDGATLVWTF